MIPDPAWVDRLPQTYVCSTWAAVRIVTAGGMFALQLLLGRQMFERVEWRSMGDDETSGYRFGGRFGIIHAV